VNKRNVTRIVTLVLVVAVIAYTHRQNHGQQPKVELAATIPADAQEFTLGKLNFKACQLPERRSGATTSAFCTPFSVLENRADPGGRKLNMRLALIKSDAIAADTDIVVFLSGGPGESAVDTWPAMAGPLEPLRRHHHILLLDQRGTGESHPLTCKAEEESKNPESKNQEQFDLDVLRKHVSNCLAEVEKQADPRFYTTTDAAKDLEEVRQALGAPLFDLVGVSYGTRMAQQYAMHYPQSVRSIVLDSVAPNQLILGEEFAVSLDDSLKAQFKRCNDTPACAKAFGDPYVSLFKLRDQLRAHPQDFSYRDPTTFEVKTMRVNEYTLAGLVRLFAYSPETAAMLPLSIDDGLKGDYTPLTGQAKLLGGDLADLQENGMQMSVICSEDADLLTPRPQDSELLLGTKLVDALKAECEIWPHGTRPADFHEGLKTATPVLILEGQLDPVTPPRYGRQVLEGLSNGRLLVAPGVGHSVLGRGCLPNVVGEFVDKLDPKTLDAKCVDQLGPMPAFVNANGAAP
jgi:pimeloyl-ACP methyl ester carboxylesterase